MADNEITGLTVTIRRQEDQGQYLAFVNVGGAEVPIARGKLAYYDDLIREAPEQPAEQPAAEPAPAEQQAEPSEPQE